MPDSPEDRRFRTDVVIIGAGPVGLFAVFQCGMLGMRCHVIDTLEAVGGQCSALYPEKPIYDIPSRPEVSAAGLIADLERQVEPFHPVYHLGRPAVSLETTAEGRHLVGVEGGPTIDAAAVFIAAGVGAFGPNRPPLDGIERFENLGPGRGVNYLVKRIEDFRNQRVVIAGGGDAAVDWALALAEIADGVSVVHRRHKFRAQAESVARLEALAESGRAELVIPFQLGGLEGDGDGLKAVRVYDLDGGQRELPADVILPFFGLSQNLGPIAEWGAALEGHRLVVDPATAMTDVEGVFAIGDVSTYPGKLKLILTGFAETARAAHSAYALAFPGKALHFEYSTTKGVHIL